MTFDNNMKNRDKIPGNEPEDNLPKSRFSVSHYICPPGYEIERFFEAAAEAGAGAVALTVRALDEAGPEKLAALLKEYALSVSSLNSAGYFTLPPGRRKEAQEALNRRLVDAAAIIGAEVLCIITGGLREAGLDLDLARGRIDAGLEALSASAAAAGVPLGLEPIHPAEIAAKGCINSIADARRVAAGFTNIGLILDHFHSWWDPDLRSIFEKSLPEIRLLQICAVRPPAESGWFRRGALSDTGIPANRLVTHAEKAGYSGWYEFELFADALDGRDVATLLVDAAAVLNEALR